MKQLVAFAAALALAGCVAGPTMATAVRADGHARLGEPTRVGRLVVTPQSVIEDSRCPVNARCVWAGRLVLSARIEGNGWRETVNLTLGEPHATHGSGLSLVSAEPGKLAGTATPPSTLFGFEPR